MNNILTSDGETVKPSRSERYAYSGSPDPGLERLVDRRYSLRRSRLVDCWLQYADAEGFTQCDRVVAL